MRKRVNIYPDGACRGNPGPGGWGVLLQFKDKEKTLWGGEPETTNNRMELMAAIKGLEALSRPCHVELCTDSQYVMKGMTEWLPAWKRRGWKRLQTLRSRMKTSGSAWIAQSKGMMSRGVG